MYIYPAFQFEYGKTVIEETYQTYTKSIRENGGFSIMHCPADEQACTFVADLTPTVQVVEPVAMTFINAKFQISLLPERDKLRAQSDMESEDDQRNDNRVLLSSLVDQLLWVLNNPKEAVEKRTQSPRWRYAQGVDQVGAFFSISHREEGSALTEIAKIYFDQKASFANQAKPEDILKKTLRGMELPDIAPTPEERSAGGDPRNGQTNAPIPQTGIKLAGAHPV